VDCGLQIAEFGMTLGPSGSRVGVLNINH